MKKPLKYIVVIVMILLIYYFIQLPNTNTPLINEVSLVEHNAKIAGTESPEQSKADLVPTEPESELNLAEKSKPKDDGELSYLAAYREIVQYQRCMMINYRRRSGDDLIAEYIKDYDRFAENPMKPNEVQIDHYKDQIDSCFSLLLNEKEETREGFLRLSTRLKNITPETDEEIALSQALELNKKLQQISNQLFKEKSGYHQITKEQREANMKKKSVLYDELKLIRTRNDRKTTDEDMRLIELIYQQISNLNKFPEFEINTEEISFLENEYTSHALELKEFFKNNQTPDIFLIFAEHLLNERKGKFFFKEDVNNKLGIYDTDYIKTLNKHIVPFVACTLDYPCGPDSYFSIDLCIHQENEAKACGKNVIDYYLDDLISHNQMIDFNNYFNYLMDNHAKQ